MAHTVIACSGTTTPYVPRVGIGAIGIEGGAHVKMCVLPPGSCGSGAGTEIASDLAVYLNLQEPVGIALKLPSACEL